MQVSILAVAIALGLASPAAAQRTELVCTFTQGVITDLDSAPVTEASEDAPLLLLFRDIDFNAGTARLVGNAVPEGVEVMAVPGVNSFSFIEITPSGSVNTTSVFPVGAGEPAPTVTSRHVSYGQTPIISQLFGTCRR